ncbi:LOW QUALITY PROTEIN: hypothetical protein CRUP_009885 [Coryphaenoides rupestris]|nr:LOW QUALITY PROTEIN: hypothetical protein CRUP_009885 [Coryphaenoides rupestris]
MTRPGSRVSPCSRSSWPSWIFLSPRPTVVSMGTALVSMGLGHCFYHGEVQGVEASSVAVSTCAGLRGLISLNASVSYVVEPLPVSMDTQSRSPLHAS